MQTTVNKSVEFSSSEAYLFPIDGTKIFGIKGPFNGAGIRSPYLGLKL